MLASATTLVHLATSSATLDLNSSAWSAMVSLPSPRSRSITDCSARIALISALTLSTNGSGQSRRTRNAEPGRHRIARHTASAIVGTSGNAKNRFGPVTAIGRSRPSLRNGSSTVGVSTWKSMRLATRSVIACGEPRYGTCWILALAIATKKLEREMHPGSIARRGVGLLAIVRLRDPDDIGDRLHRVIGICDQDEREVRQHADEAEVFDRIVRQSACKSPPTPRGRPAGPSGRTVRSGARDSRSRRGAAGAGTRLDDDRLAQPLAEIVRDQRATMSTFAPGVKPCIIVIGRPLCPYDRPGEATAKWKARQA